MGNKVNIIILLCVCLGLVFRIAYCIKYPVQPRDAYAYSSTIYEWEEIGTAPSSHHQLSLWILKIPYHFFKMDIVKGGVVINMLLGLLIIAIGIKALSCFFKDSSVICLSGIILATHPTLIRFSCSCLRENTYLLFAIITVFQLSKYYKYHRISLLMLAGFWSALAFLCRLEGMEIEIVVFVVLALLIFEKKITATKVFFHFISFLLCFVLTIIFVYHAFNFKSISKNTMGSRIDWNNFFRQ